MGRRSGKLALAWALGAGALAWVAGLAVERPAAAPGRREVLQQFAARFAREIYPLMNRQQNGCVICHFTESARKFKVLASPASTFSYLLDEELFNPRDPMAIAARLSASDATLHMPKLGTWAAEEIQRMRDFSAGLDAALRSSADPDPRLYDERFPDSLLLAYDGRQRDPHTDRLLDSYQLSHSLEAIFGKDWYDAAGADPLAGKAYLFGGADFRTSFEISRTPTANYLTALQQVAREMGRRFVSAPPGALFPGFDPNVLLGPRTRPQGARNVRVLYNRILFRNPTPAETAAALALVADIQRQPPEDRVVRFTLVAGDDAGRQDQVTLDVTLRRTTARVSRFRLDQTRRPPRGADPWVRVGTTPFRFEAKNPDHMIRMVSPPGNRVTAFDAIKLVRMENGTQTAESVVLDNSDPECTTVGDWRAVPKSEESDVVGSNHYQSRNLTNELHMVTMALRLGRDGDYDVYLRWPAAPNLTSAAMVEVHSATPTPARPDSGRAEVGVAARGQAINFVNQAENYLNEQDLTRWRLINRQAFLKDENDFVEISNRGVQPGKHVVADAVKFEPLNTAAGAAIVVDNGDKEGFQASDGWTRDRSNEAGRRHWYGDDYLVYPPTKDGRQIADPKNKAPEEKREVWARYRPIQKGQYRPGWYRVYVWSPGAAFNSDWVPVEVHGTDFGPVAWVETPPIFQVGETAELNASATYHPAWRKLSLRWTHNAQDLGLKLQGADTATPSFVVPDLRSGRPGWAALIEALLQHAEFLIPRGKCAPGVVECPARLVRAALDLVGRVPTPEETRQWRAAGLARMVDQYLASDQFRHFFFHRTRAVLMSRGTPESDEPARLWTYLATHDLSFRELVTADYSIDENWEKKPQSPEHGHTGMLTMKGYLVGKPGLPAYTYPAKVLTFTLGLTFEVTDVVVNARQNVVSTTDPASLCYSCHKLLTPLALQRLRWTDDGRYRTRDEKGKEIDDTDQNVIPDYPFKGRGLEAFSAQVVKKEKFVRSFIDLHHDMLFHRKLRVFEDERNKYKELYEAAVADDLRIRPLLKKMILMEVARPHGPAGAEAGSRAPTRTPHHAPS